MLEGLGALQLGFSVVERFCKGSFHAFKGLRKGFGVQGFRVNGYHKIYHEGSLRGWS